MPTLRSLLLVLAFICFVLHALGVTSSRVELLSIGLAFLTASFFAV